METNKTIKVKEINNCPFCKKKGTIFYEKMSDRFFNISGLWSLLQCENCKLVWLSPRPVSEDIGKTYDQYYTHDNIISDKSSLKEKVKMSLIAANFDYKNNPKIQYSKALRALFKLIPFLKKIFGKRAMNYLFESKGAKLLDVGCGNGESIALMKDLGWEVIGVEPDRRAADFARKKFGIKVFNQTFEKSDFPSNYFDALIMKHVIEHNEDPVEFLRKARRVLKPGGKLVVVTPNIKSFAHSIFKKNWVHLDPPRHLFLFSPKTINECALAAGFKNPKVKVAPTAGKITYCLSKNIQKQRKAKESISFYENISGIFFQILEILLSFFKKDSGEEIVLESVKFQSSPTKDNICALVVSHKPGRDFILNLKSIIPQVAKVIIVNNGSDFFEKANLGKKIHLINNLENLGQGKALNQGAIWAFSQGYQWVLLLDQDSLLAPSMIIELIRAYQSCPEREKVKIIGPNCTFRNIKEVKYKKECNGKLYFERDVVMISGSLLSLSAYNKIGPFREEFFIDTLELDCCLRLRRQGFKIIVACNAQMIHSVGHEAVIRRLLWKKFLVTNHNYIRCYYMTRNDLILIKEYLFREPYWVLRNLAWLFFIKPALVIFFEKDKIKKIKSMFLGVGHALINKTGSFEK